ncbi:TrbG/VirB9 family P-type conjugative transfer protein [Massilia sp. R2A-15]|uniref:TrbG/VirB9 family P-type conjugative transfer protein n=1 Tax=Massilia sp. R2A-15 TaxID=3064278 RepID=UPI002736088B|nr:TrbG/VirB9 family P-type conjugative transfer protein [Massilia sp. R2A-15]WLI87820.1 TrbG/VirB9 family P-type conjugative transfer protein [Massilia sp. R2A-15]
MMRGPLVACILAVCCAGVAPASGASKKGVGKSATHARAQANHFRTIPYTGDIVVVQAMVGRMLEIEFGKAETSIEFAMGDREAWYVKTVGNVMFIKPKAAVADTNLRVITNRRKYWFDLVMTDRLGGLPYHLDFKYPPEPVGAPISTPEALAGEGKLAIDQQLSSALRAAIAKTVTGSAGSGTLNGNYDFIGPDELLPTAAYDNGEMTYIEFAPNNPMPVVFAVDEDGKESRVNFHVERDVLIVHRTARRLVFRRDQVAACLINGNFRTSGASATYTSSQAVQRKVKGEPDVP